MREVEVSRLTDVIEKLCIEANEHLPEDVKCAITGCRACEDGEIAKGVLDKIVENYEIADAQKLPRVSLTILLRILILQITRTCRSARIQEWHVYSLK